jgi:hypothetical protein
MSQSSSSAQAGHPITEPVLDIPPAMPELVDVAVAVAPPPLVADALMPPAEDAVEDDVIDDAVVAAVEPVDSNPLPQPIQVAAIATEPSNPNARALRIQAS